MLGGISAKFLMSSEYWRQQFLDVHLEQCHFLCIVLIDCAVNALGNLVGRRQREAFGNEITLHFLSQFTLAAGSDQNAGISLFEFDGRLFYGPDSHHKDLYIHR
jgi:hypothetical protein